MALAEEFPPNSHAARSKRSAEPEPKKIEKVTTGEVTRRRKPLGKRFTETFVGGDARGVWGYVVGDVLLPAARDMFADAITQGVERMIFGENTRPRRGGFSRGGSGNYTNYGKFSTSSGPVGRAAGREEQRPVRTLRETYDPDEIIMATRVEADQVLYQLEDLIGKYDGATVSDLYEMVGITPGHNDNKWGWKDLRDSRVRGTRGGYLLELPRPIPMD